MSVSRKDKKTISIVLASANALSGATNNAYFMIDWNAILEPHTPYVISFCYFGGLNSYDGIKPALVSIDFNTNSYKLGSTNFTLATSNILGILEPYVLKPNVNNVYLSATTDTNKPVYIERRPSNNIFNIRILRTDLTTLWIDDSSVLPANWIITLHFTKALSPLYKIPVNKQLVLTNDYGTGTASNKTYNLNGFIEKSQEYRIAFTFISQKPNVGNNGRPMLVFLNFTNEAYIANSSTNITSSKSGFIGFIARIRYDIGIDSSYLFSNYLTNEPVNSILSYQGFLNVRFTNLDLTETTYIGTNWALILSFEEV